jgi:16S rRNA (cytosine967-C5)-methyltransferase
VIAPARVAAFHALREVATSRLTLADALARSRARLADERDRALAADIVTGTLRWQRRLDYLIEHASRRPTARIDPDVLLLLRLAAYQLLHLDRVPVAAAVNDAVNQTRAAGRTSAAPFVNAVLRTLSRMRHRPPLPPPPEGGGDRAGAIRYLAITHSHPEWLVERWLDRYGFEAAERWVRFDNETPRLTLRVNRLRLTRADLQAALAADGIDAEPTRYAPDGLIIRSGNPLRRPLDGRFVVQDEASQLVTLAVGSRPGDRILDLCASPGGKTTAMAADMHDTGLVVATDVRHGRVRLLAHTVAASGASCIRVIHVADRGPLPLSGTFDRVLVDAPCSGLGTIRRDPDIRWRRSAAELAGFAARQRALLDRAAGAVRPGGRLVYATCSSEPEENEDLVAAWLAEHRDFRALDLRREAAPAYLPLLDEAGMLHTTPDAHRLEAFYAAALERVAGGPRR